MQIVFVDNLLIDGSSWSRKVDMQPHLGLLSLIATAEGAGHDCRLYNPKLAVAGGLRLDETLYEALADEILQLSPQVVGFTALGCNFICVLQVATCIKRRDA